MSESFADRIDAKMQKSRDHLKRQRAEMTHRMVELEKRQEQFNRLGTQLVSEIVTPSLEEFADRFDNIRFDLKQPLRCRCTLMHCLKFPATGYVGFRVEHDADISRLSLVFEAHFLPVFVQYPRSDEIDFPLNAVDLPRATAWVEEKLLAFLDAYLQLPWLDQYQRDNLVTDPVCGMRISKAQAIEHQHEGQSYYFCAEQCVDRFQKEPDRYVGSP